MKRIGKEACLALLEQGARIVSRDWFMIGAGYRVEFGEIVFGFITFELWLKLHRMGLIVKESSNYWTTYYRLNK